ncbi:PREDICTED: uncharacterized protein LOC105556707 [Vollenhovia emeryi]|uniref:uncharacterized protein LOC105556707 n=1 Tax=Vollenhovia emeryi TaxID=411798 RepID=UPI0005F4B5FF|nr:PREDICTED: uncharacterized protein LOC105556707 [Vollenhovia emeryi]
MHLQKQRKSNKRAATEEYEKFLYNNSMEKISEHGINDSEQITDSNGHAAKRCSQDQEQLSVNYNQSKQTVFVPLGELSNLHEKVVQKIEEKMEKSNKMMEEKFIEIVKEQLTQAYEKTVFKMEEVMERICSNIDKHSTSSIISSETENKVHLGSGYYCTQASFITMKRAKNDCDWTVTLLVGVFGEDAKLMRVYPRKPGLKKFPLLNGSTKYV